MRQKLSLILIFTCLMATALPNIAYQDANVRFTVITDGTIRMEYAPDGNFIDQPSFLAIERDYDDVSYEISDKGNKVKISTPKMLLTYRKGNVSFYADNLQFALVVPIGKVDCANEHVIEVIYNSSDIPNLANGIIGKSRRIADAVEYIKFHGCDTHADELAALGTLCQAVSYNTENLTLLTKQFETLYNDLPGVLQRQGMTPSVARTFIQRVK